MNESYNFNEVNYSINISDDPNNCINNLLQENNLCPCPPDISYNANKNEINIMNKDFGLISLIECN